jgi:peptidoglycan/xylan/chitin deacetylase (PgdA/CDA1 family)
MIFRDDDISKDTDLKKFKAVRDLFNKYGVLHTVALICKDIEQNKPLLKYLKSQKNIDVQVHAWEHFNFQTDLPKLHEQLPLAVELVTKHFNKPTVLYPPWNKSSIGVERIAWDNGLKVMADKISLSQYLRGVKGNVINFHYWAPECSDLEAALKKYVNK